MLFRSGAQAVWQQEAQTPIRLVERKKPKKEESLQKRAPRFVVGRS